VLVIKHHVDIPEYVNERHQLSEKFEADVYNMISAFEPSDCSTAKHVHFGQ